MIYCDCSIDRQVTKRTETNILTIYSNLKFGYFIISILLLVWSLHKKLRESLLNLKLQCSLCHFILLTTLHGLFLVCISKLKHSHQKSKQFWYFHLSWYYLQKECVLFSRLFFFLALLKNGFDFSGFWTKLSQLVLIMLISFIL